MNNKSYNMRSRNKFNKYNINVDKYKNGSNSDIKSEIPK